MTANNLRKFFAIKKQLEAEAEANGVKPIEAFIPEPVDMVPLARTMRLQLPSAYLYGYIRVSTMDQFKSGLSLETQLKQVTHFIDRIRNERDQWALHKFAGVYIEGPASATKPISERPVGKVLCERLRPGDGVIFLKYNRAFRCHRHLLNQKHEWDKKNIRMLFMDLDLDLSTPMGQMILGIMSLVAEVEVRNISDQTRAGLAAKKARGDKLGACSLAGMVIVRTYNAELDRRTSREYIRHDLMPIIRLVGFYKEHLKMSHRQISDRIETMQAKREGRPPRPAVTFRTPRTWTEGRIKSVYRTWKTLVADRRRLNWWEHSKLPEEVGMVRGQPYETVDPDRKIPGR